MAHVHRPAREHANAVAGSSKRVVLAATCLSCKPDFMHAKILPLRTSTASVCWPGRRCACRLTVAHHRQSRSTATVAAGPGSSSSSSWTVESAGSRHEGQRDDLHVVLVHPQIPQNAGSVARTCAATNTALHLIQPLGFEIDDLKLKRAGLDYWPHVVVKVHNDWAAFHDFFRKQGRGRLIAFSKFGRKSHTAPGTYQPGDWLLFGAETSGLPDEAHAASTHVVKIPMPQAEHVRSLNLAVSVGVGVFEAIRQLEQQQ